MWVGVRNLYNSVLLIDKPAGITSYSVIDYLKRVSGQKKIGHCGTLDKFASGLLVVCTGQATKLSRYFLNSDKRYLATIQLGITTDTGDCTGSIVNRKDKSDLAKEDIINTVECFRGKIRQMPPLYSALKVNGKRASDLVRNGEKVELNEREIYIHNLLITDIDLNNLQVSIDVTCSKGTYIRSLARDIGERLEAGGHLSELRRIESGKFSVKNAAAPEEVKEYIEGGIVNRNFFQSPVNALSDFSAIVVNKNAAEKVKNGAFFLKDDAVAITRKDKNFFIILDENENLIAIADIDIDKWHIDYKNVFNQCLVF